MIPEQEQISKEQVNEQIGRHGFIIVPMIDIRSELPLVTHTVGLGKLHGFPELIVVGIDMETSVGLINYAIHAMRERGGAFKDMELLPLPEEAPPGSPRLCVRTVMESEFKAFPLPASIAHYGDKVPSYQQISMTDMNGKLPWEEEFHEHARDTQRMFWTEGGVRKVIGDRDLEHIGAEGFFAQAENDEEKPTLH